MEFQSNYPYISCGNGCNAHFQVIVDEKIDENKMQQFTHEHNQKCTPAAPYTVDKNAFYFFEETPVYLKSKHDWKGFRAGLSTDQAYLKIRMSAFNTPGQLAGEWLGNAAAIESEDWRLIAINWQSLLSHAASIELIESEIKNWNELALKYNMPFSFNLKGQMILKG